MITLAELDTLIRRELRGRQLPVAELDESVLLSDLGLSSLQIADIVFTLEDDHEVEFDAAKAADAKTIGDVIALGNEALAEASNPGA